MGSKRTVTKKTPKATPRISPKIPQPKAGRCIYYEDLDNGDCFLLAGRLWMKSDHADQEATDMGNGDVVYELCKEVVIPVDIKITWKKK